MRNFFNFKGLNFWLVGTGIGLNLIWTAALMTLAAIITRNGEAPEWLPLLEIVGAFLGPLGIGLWVSSMAHEARGPVYGLVGSLGSAILILIVVFPANFQIGFIMFAVAILGGLNGGMISQRK